TSHVLPARIRGCGQDARPSCCGTAGRGRRRWLESTSSLSALEITVPVPIPRTDGRLFVDALVVMTYVEGGPPETEADWRRVADTLRQLHPLDAGLAAAPRQHFRRIRRQRELGGRAHRAI